ncbi:hypothetical protein [Cupriavidus sp. USMAA2-4]|uniref:hypothetical protein n=1 Tax=Cupriavidus sp. USMAA2-4 TaxID=876364 RepID=UPI000A45F661|nr:hypothetical protein [Cupriavidus sp. USMAA2-4]
MQDCPTQLSRQRPRAARAPATASRTGWLPLLPLLAGLSAVVAWHPACAADGLVIRTMGPVSYVCGGVAEDERQALAAQEQNFNMGVLFTRGENGEYLADVSVRLVYDGQEVARFRANGPRCLIRAPEGSYNIEASYKGQPRSLTVNTGTRNAQLRW